LPRGYPIELKKLGDHLRKRRLDRGLWQRTVAQELGVRPETIRLWENGLARPLPRQFGKIVRFLGYDPEPADPTLTGRLRTIRRRLGLSQVDFATKVGLDEGRVCRWENGSQQPSRWMANRVAAILDRLEDDSNGPDEATHRSAGLPPLTYFDRTRWRRRPPTDLTEGEPKSLGERIRHRRLELGLSQIQLAKRFGVGRSAVRQWERGKSVPQGLRRYDVIAFLGWARKRSRHPSK